MSWIFSPQFGEIKYDCVKVWKWPLTVTNDLNEWIIVWGLREIKTRFPFVENTLLQIGFWFYIFLAPESEDCGIKANSENPTTNILTVQYWRIAEVLKLLGFRQDVKKIYHLPSLWM